MQSEAEKKKPGGEAKQKLNNQMLQFKQVKYGLLCHAIFIWNSCIE